MCRHEFILWELGSGALVAAGQELKAETEPGSDSLEWAAGKGLDESDPDGTLKSSI